MSAYCVRLIENGEIVGIFSASSLGSLAELVDEVCPVSATEYARLRDGGIIWEKCNAPKTTDLYLFDTDEEEPAATVSDGNPQVTEVWQFALSKLKFKTWPKDF